MDRNCYLQVLVTVFLVVALIAIVIIVVAVLSALYQIIKEQVKIAWEGGRCCACLCSLGY
jgi:hypothetical protein